MIYFLSDPHGDPNFAGIKRYLEIANKNDILIILGDVCLNFEDTEENRVFTERFLASDKTIAFIDGNHENYAYLKSFPREIWCGGAVRRVGKKTYYLERGNIYKIQGKSFFVFGGCKSSPKWRVSGPWYPGEEPTDEEIVYAKENLQKHSFTVDYILTHKYSNRIDSVVCQKLLDLTCYMEENVTYKKWYCGHEHRKKDLDKKHQVIYDELVILE